jgi:hypothetical protein
VRQSLPCNEQSPEKLSVILKRRQRHRCQEPLHTSCTPYFSVGHAGGLVPARVTASSHQVSLLIWEALNKTPLARIPDV